MCLWGWGEDSRGGWLKGAVDGFKKGKALLLNIWLRNWVIILEEMENSRRTVPGRLCCVWQTRCQEAVTATRVQTGMEMRRVDLGAAMGLQL